eukprot:scaffold567_cov384-Prasinococcus_capsulatus_cf.AAC.6
MHSESFRSRVELRLKERIDALSKTNNALIRYTARMQEDMRQMKSQLLLVKNERHHLQMVLALKKQEVADLTELVNDLSMKTTAAAKADTTTITSTPSVATRPAPEPKTPAKAVSFESPRTPASKMKPSQEDRSHESKDSTPNNAPEEEEDTPSLSIQRENGRSHTPFGLRTPARSANWKAMRGQAFAAIDSFLKLHDCELRTPSFSLSTVTQENDGSSSVLSPPTLEVRCESNVLASRIVRNAKSAPRSHSGGVQSSNIMAAERDRRGQLVAGRTDLPISFSSSGGSL